MKPILNSLKLKIGVEYKFQFYLVRHFIVFDFKFIQLYVEMYNMHEFNNHVYLIWFEKPMYQVNNYL